MLDLVPLEGLVANWLWSVAKDLIVTTRLDKWPDFELRDGNGARLLVELKSKPPSVSALRHLAERLRTVADPSARFILVTPEAPTPEDLRRFSSAFSNIGSTVQWVELSQLPDLLGKPSPGPWDSPQTWATLQTEALTGGLERYATAPVGSAPYETTDHSTELADLTRQFPYRVIAQLKAGTDTIESQLGLGSRREGVTIVLSDIVNFSSLVTASRPDDLKEAMARYYTLAREAVFQHGGMLDKFIGDAVLAVFGYPLPNPAAACDAMQFARALTRIGQVVMESWQAELNAVIPTGTRIGIATGDIWPINIGASTIEITLLGDTINLAARLEKNCEINKLLVDNRTRTAAQRADAAFVDSLNLQQTIIPAADAKGQAFPIKAWALP